VTKIYFKTDGSNIKLAVIGLGYVGFTIGKVVCDKTYVMGFDINESRVAG
jgi:UDP-N-acetyl-D-mannosaminuronate dehydrogenase